MRQRTLILISIILLAAPWSFGQKSRTDSFKVVFYNVENLYDTINDPHTDDNEFLPTSKVAWTGERMYHKIHNIGKVLVAIDSTNLPAIIGMAEVENKTILEDLVEQTRLRNGNYQVVLEEGNDPRGIDVALIFRKDVFSYLAHKAVPSAKSFRSRFILYIKLLDAKKDTFHLFVNHWKSREGGPEETAIKRAENASVLKHLTDSIFSVNIRANIIVMGDFNDEPSDQSIAGILGAVPPGKQPAAGTLYNLLYETFQKGGGTLYYKDWDLFDQIMASGSLLMKKRGKGPVILPPYGYVFKQEWMLFRNKKGEMIPNRTASSKEYFGGYSDHLPVYTVIKY